MNQAVEDDLLDEVADYSTLLKSKGGVFKRGNKAFAPDDTDQQASALTSARQAFYELIGEKRPLTGSHCSGILNREDGSTLVTVPKGNHLKVMGHSVHGKLYLHLEEAAWLIDRQAMDVRTSDNAHGTFADYCALMFSSSDGWISYEKYQVFAFLKRLGYIVRRAPSHSLQPAKDEQAVVPRQALWSWMYQGAMRLWTWWCHRCMDPFRRLFAPSLPLRPFSCRSYGQMYSILQQPIQCQSWYNRPQQHQPSREYTVAWDVYKPRPNWKKRDPGVPDFRVVVARMQDALPQPETLKSLFQQVAQWPAQDKAYGQIPQTKNSQPAFLMALAGDVEGLLFVRLQADGVASVVDFE
ncbi:hypothetical protein DM01DRAFT_1409604 [Hesseltinella vesiculosa]|uniref:tRNA-splicing endonuclease subunit Sen54 N-terminal domain-containing protein n=1 Tax=Hesseltinella vesiculosa TaxID=101127 RepID=A0A1X2GAE1_9FUNG|nr:hypothetical protein DM01DRAFT_1409604 [Hesseltinella vesiculosa]